MFFVYILFSEKLNKYYIGYTRDIDDRLAKHNRSMRGFTSLGKPWKLVYIEQLDTKQAAMTREQQLKNWKNSVRIESLIKKSGSGHPD
jgi:putative endonuclease